MFLVAPIQLAWVSIRMKLSGQECSISLDSNTWMDISIPLSIVMDIGIPFSGLSNYRPPQNFLTLSYLPLVSSYTTVIRITGSWYPVYPHISPFPRFFRSIRTLKKRFYSLKLHLYLRGSRDIQQMLNITFFRYREEHVNLSDGDNPGSNRKNRKSFNNHTS